jgi:hypothetical protein
MLNYIYSNDGITYLAGMCKQDLYYVYKYTDTHRQTHMHTHTQNYPSVSTGDCL